jgi:hypothetical protein
VEFHDLEHAVVFVRNMVVVYNDDADEGVDGSGTEIDRYSQNCLVKHGNTSMKDERSRSR